jgi:lipoprotein-anchoring transpeptidase ErfK/SrfK
MQVIKLIFMLLISFCYIEATVPKTHALPECWIEVSIPHQRLYLHLTPSQNISYHISTAKNGAGQLFGSYQTPMGWHRIREKIGHGAPLYAIFRNKIYIKRCWNPKEPTRNDLVLTRILTLDGMQPGYNHGISSNGECIDSYSRSIYIHGTAEEHLIGLPTSHGCIRMKNCDVIDLFDRVPLGTYVWIHQ